MIEMSQSDTMATNRGQRMRWLALSAFAASTLFTAIPIGTAAATDAVQSEAEALDVLQLGCEGRERDGAALVACRWTVPDGAIGVRVFRVAGGSGAAREVVHRTSNPWANTFADTNIRRGVRYTYVVQAVGAAGQVVAMSRPAVAGVAPLPDPTVEVLRLNCSATGDVTVRCAWSDVQDPARTLTLWRSVDGAIRERVASFAQPFPTSYGDIVPGSTSQAVYAVIATDGAGEIVARSRAQLVEFAGPAPTVTAVPLPTVPAADPAPAPPRPTTVPVTTAPATTVPVATVPVATAPAPVTVPATTTPPAATIPAPTTVPVTTVAVPTRPTETNADDVTPRIEPAPEPVRVAVVEREWAG